MLEPKRMIWPLNEISIICTHTHTRFAWPGVGRVCWYDHPRVCAIWQAYHPTRSQDQSKLHVSLSFPFFVPHPSHFISKEHCSKKGSGTGRWMRVFWERDRGCGPTVTMPIRETLVQAAVWSILTHIHTWNSILHTHKSQLLLAGLSKGCPPSGGPLNLKAVIHWLPNSLTQIQIHMVVSALGTNTSSDPRWPL